MTDSTRPTPPSHIALVGAGHMGQGIARSFASQGVRVILVDRSEEILEDALRTITERINRRVERGEVSAELRDLTLKNLEPSPYLNEAVRNAPLVIEAINEVEESKRKLFLQLDEVCEPHTILASNTSSISITSLAAVTQRPDRVVGLHFMDPVVSIPLVEVVSGLLTSPETRASVIDMAHSIGKQAFPVSDYPGFVSNRLLFPLINEAINLVYEGVADIESVDRIMHVGLGHPMGPLELADYLGLDMVQLVLGVLHRSYGHSHYLPNPLLVNLVEAGLLGAKTGEGFYRWDQDRERQRPSPRFTTRQP